MVTTVVLTPHANHLDASRETRRDAIELRLPDLALPATVRFPASCGFPRQCELNISFVRGFEVVLLYVLR